MIFKSKTNSIIYFENCLLNPPVFPGTLSSEKYLTELHFEALGNFKSDNELSELVGEVIGTICTNIIIGVAILEVSRLLDSKNEVKKLENLFQLLIEKEKRHIAMALNVGNITDEYSTIRGIKLPSSTLNKQVMANSASRNLRYLISARNDDVRLESEMGIVDSIRAVRINALNQLPPSLLKRKLFEGINEILGCWPEEED